MVVMVDHTIGAERLDRYGRHLAFVWRDGVMLNEELVRRPATDRITFEGIISEDVTPVGSVHLGAVFRIQTPAPEAYVPGSELYRFAWMSTGTLKELTLELWSELALELISPDPSHPGS